MSKESRTTRSNLHIVIDGLEIGWPNSKRMYNEGRERKCKWPKHKIAIFSSRGLMEGIKNE